MITMKRTLKGLAFTAVLALSLVATSAPAFAAQATADTTITATARPKHPPKIQVVNANGVSWEGAFNALGATWE